MIMVQRLEEYFAGKRNSTAILYFTTTTAKRYRTFSFAVANYSNYRKYCLNFSKNSHKVIIKP